MEFERSEDGSKEGKRGLGHAIWNHDVIRGIILDHLKDIAGLEGLYEVITVSKRTWEDISTGMYRIFSVSKSQYLNDIWRGNLSGERIEFYNSKVRTLVFDRPGVSPEPEFSAGKMLQWPKFISRHSSLKAIIWGDHYSGFRYLMDLSCEGEPVGLKLGIWLSADENSAWEKMKEALCVAKEVPIDALGVWVDEDSDLEQLIAFEDEAKGLVNFEGIRSITIQKRGHDAMEVDRLLYFLKGKHQLERLWIQGTIEWSAKHFQHLLGPLTNLLYLKIEDPSKNELRYMREPPPWSTGISDIMKGLENCRHLQKMSLTLFLATEDLEYARDIDLESILARPNNFHNLQEVSLRLRFPSSSQSCPSVDSFAARLNKYFLTLFGYQPKLYLFSTEIFRPDWGDRHPPEMICQAAMDARKAYVEMRQKVSAASKGWEHLTALSRGKEN